MNFEMFREVVNNFGKWNDLVKKMLISTRCIHGFMSNLIKKSWTDSTIHLKSAQGNDLAPSFVDLSRREELSEIPSFVFLFFFIGRQKQFFSWRFFFFVYNLHAWSNLKIIQKILQSIKLKVDNKPAQDQTLSYHTISCFNLLPFDEFFQV